MPPFHPHPLDEKTCQGVGVVVVVEGVAWHKTIFPF